jgi:hypothetical protein
VGHLDGAISSLGTAQTVNLLRYAPDNSSSTRVVTGKWLFENLKLPMRPKNKTWSNSQIENHRKKIKLVRP